MQNSTEDVKKITKQTEILCAEISDFLSENIPEYHEYERITPEYTPTIYDDLYGFPAWISECKRREQSANILRELGAERAGRLVERRVHSSPPSALAVLERRDGSLDIQAKPTNTISSMHRYCNSGTEVEQTSVNHRGKKRIKLCARLYNWKSRQKKRKSGRRCSFITLTFGRDYPDDKEAKVLLDTFLKAFRRHVPGKEFHYVWIMEVQERGAPHFHILTPHYAPKDWLNSTWNRIAGAWQRREHLETQTLYPEIAAVRHSVESYMTKYLTKEAEGRRPMKGRIWAISTDSRKLMEAVNTTIVASDGHDTRNILDNIWQEFRDAYPAEKGWKSKYSTTAYVANAPPFMQLLHEWVGLLNLVQKQDEAENLISS